MSNSKLFVGNLAWGITEDELKAEFEGCGTIEELNIIKDQQTGRSRGFGFVKFATAQEAEKAVQTMNGKEIQGRAMNVNLAKDKKEKERW